MNWQRDLSWQWRMVQGKGLVSRIFIALWPLCVAQFVYECWTGGGLSGWLVRRQLERTGYMLVGLWTAAVFFLYVVGPLVMASVTEPKNSKPLFGKGAWWQPLALFGLLVAALLGFGLFSFWMARSGPDLNAEPVVWSVDSEGIPAIRMTQLLGQLQPEHQFRYVAGWIRGRGSNSTSGADLHVLAPVTRVGWKRREPVRYWVLTHNDEPRTDRMAKGVLLRNPLPHYLKVLMERRGLQFAEPYYVLYTNAYLADQGNWEAMAVIFGFLGTILLGIWVAAAIDDVRRHLRPR